MNRSAPVSGIAHVNLRGPGPLIERLRAFYVDVIGLREGPRPGFRSGSHGHWLYAGDRDVVHLSIDARAGEPDVPAPRGAGFNHVAFTCHGLGGMMQRLREAGVDFRVDRVDDLHQVQLFLHDPAGTRIELNFAGESLPA
jgi:glyoxylase I family protein